MPYPLRSTNVCFSCPLVLTPCEGPNSPIPAMAWFMRGTLVGPLVWRLASLQWRISQSLPTRGLLSAATSKSWVIRVFSIRGPRDLKQILLAYTPSIQHSKSWDAYSAITAQSQSCSSWSRYSWSRAWVIWWAHMTNRWCRAIGLCGSYAIYKRILFVKRKK